MADASTPPRGETIDIRLVRLVLGWRSWLTTIARDVREHKRSLYHDIRSKRQLLVEARCRGLEIALKSLVLPNMAGEAQ
jgi:hypothetical protein